MGSEMCIRDRRVGEDFAESLKICLTLSARDGLGGVLVKLSSRAARRRRPMFAGLVAFVSYTLASFFRDEILASLVDGLLVRSGESSGRVG